MNIILVKPQMGENIGLVARAMMNFGFSNLSIVSPRDGWPNEKARSASANAYSIIDQAIVFDNLINAISNISYLYAATARPRFMNKGVISSESLLDEFDIVDINNKIGIMFGPENSGLSNEEISYANKIITIPVNPEFTSINIAQSVGIICYEIGKLKNITINRKLPALATNEEINNMFFHLEEELKKRKFFKDPKKEAGMIINLRNIFKRVESFTSQDVRTLRGVIKSLSNNNSN